MEIHGPILTQASSLAPVAACIKRGGYTALKVITGWGLPSGWTRQAMTQAAQMVPHLIVRTVAGDPSYNGGKQRFPYFQAVAQEIAPWYTVRPQLYIEIGNEPNLFGWDEDGCWAYRWYLEQTIRVCRETFPQAKLIAPALLLEERCRPRRWLELCSDVMWACDAIGVHAYEHDAWLASEQRHGTTGQMELLRRLYGQFFPKHSWLLTEYGINDPATAPRVKGQRYAALAYRKASTPSLPPQVKGALYYHFCEDKSLDPQYHIAPDGDTAYRNEWTRK